MSIVSVQEQFQPSRYLVISNLSNSQEISTTRVLVSDLRTNTINLVTIEKGPMGDTGPQGPKGDPGKDGLVFDVLPISSGGTNNTNFSTNYLISYDGDKLISSPYTVNDIVNLSNATNNSITGIIAGSGIQRTIGLNNTSILDVKIGDGLKISNSTIIVDDSVVRATGVNINQLIGTLPISKGGTNNSTYAANKLIYYNGSSFTSFPLNTGNIVVSGSNINIVAGSGLIGGGLTSVPNGTVVLEIGPSSDILVEENSICLTSVGSPGTYTKVTTDDKGRVVSGSVLTIQDIISILGYTPWHAGNDGESSGLDADLLDGRHGSFYQNANNLSGTLNLDRLPNLHSQSQVGTKFVINTKGLIEDVYLADSQDIISSLGYRPLNAESDDTKLGSLNIIGSLITSAGDISLYDNLPLLGTNRPNILPSEPRGFTFNYGGSFTNKTGILAYYPTDNQLRLITNIFGSGSSIDANDINQDDINGGDAQSIYIIENLQGDISTVLFREIADQLYISTNTSQTIYGLKRFLADLEVASQLRILGDNATPTRPPLSVGNNNLLVTNLNADLLDNAHGSFYRNAANITGSFSYNNVSFNHIEGENNFIPKFTDPNEPSRKITSSNILQRSNGDIEISNERNLIVGLDDNITDSASINTLTIGENNFTSSENSISIGQHNILTGFNSATIGTRNMSSGDNSIATNLGSITRSDQSVAMGSYGITEVPNQFAFGAFRTVSSGNQILEHGQYSTVAAYLRGTETDGNWRSMTPIINLPKDKTIAFNIELLINKGLSSGVGHFLFESGIINNATYRNPLNITEILNSTTVPNSGTKIQVFNNSQLRRHYHFWNYTNPVRPESPTRIGQYINCLDAPNRELDISIRHLPTYHIYTPTQVHISGIFEKTFDGNLILDVSKPRYSGIFTQSFTSPHISIYSKNHGVVQDSEVDIEFVSSFKYFLPRNRYKSLLSGTDSFFISAPVWTGIKQTVNNETKIYIQNTSQYDQLFSFDFIGSIASNIITIPDNLVNHANYRIDQIAKNNMIIKLIQSNSNIAYNRIIQSISGNKLIINYPLYSDSSNPQELTGDIRVIIDRYSFFVYKECDALYINSEFHNIKGAKATNTAQFFPDLRFSFINDGGSGTVTSPQEALLYSNQNNSIDISVDDIDQNGVFDFDDTLTMASSPNLSNNSLTFSISVPYDITNISNGSVVSIRPVFNYNTGTLNLYHRNTYDCTYNSTYSDLNKHSGCYIRWKDNNNYHRISIFDSGNRPVNFISNPPSFELSNGYLSDNNKFFDIRQSGNRYFLYANHPFDYETSNVIPIRVKASSHKNNTTPDFEKILNIYIENQKENPLVFKPISNFSIYANDIFEYSIPNDTFVDSDTGIPEYSAEIKGGHPLPRWLVFNKETVSFSGTPDICDIGAYSIDLIAIDKDGFKATDNFIIEVTDNSVSSMEMFAYDVSNILRTQNIFLTQNSLVENAPPSTLVGELRHIGGYNPYITFLTAENNFSGILTKNSDIIRKCEPILQHYIPASISGSPEFLSVYSNVSLKDDFNNTLGSGYKVKNVYKPTIFSGTPINNGQIIFDNTDFDYSVSTLFTNQLLPMRNVNPSFGSRMRIGSFNDYSATLTNGLLQEKRGSDIDLILTENNEVINHNMDELLISYYIEEEDRFNDICSENEVDKLIYTNYHGYRNISWSTKNMYSWLFTESEESNLVPENNVLQNLQSENISNLESISHPPTYTNVELLTENYDNIDDEAYFSLTADIVDHVWYSDYPVKIYRQFHNDIDKSFIDNNNSNYPLNPLKNLYYSNDTVGLLQSNIDYKRDNDQLNYAHDYWYLDKELNNAVLYVDKLGSDDNAHFITEQRTYVGAYINSEPYEYGLLITEDGHGIISNTKTHHGSRIELSERYEILESIDVFNDNGKIFLDSSIDTLLCENNDLVVHDYAISAKSGTAYILFPGKNNQIKINYPNRASLSANRIGYGQQGYYEDQLSLLPTGLKFTEPNFFYTWGKLIPYRLYTDEYAVRLDSAYSGISQNGKICYSGNIPDSGHYFPEIFQTHNFTTYTGICPTAALSGGFNGFGIRENYNDNGEYVTGLVTFYTDVTSSKIFISAINDEFNLDERNTDYLRIYNPVTSAYNAQLPRIGTYFDIDILSDKSFSVENLFLYPSIYNIVHSGNISVNLDRNHNRKSYSPKIVNKIPIIFNSVYNSNQNRLPKNNFFEIESISGNRIYTRDDRSYLLKEGTYPDYFDHPIRALYLTNGCSFLGSLFHDNNKIYDIRPNLTSFDQVYNNATFEFNKDKKELAINLPTGFVRAFDNIELFNFAALSPYMIFDTSRVYHTGFTVLEQNMSIRNTDPTPEQDFILMERSLAVLAPDNIERLTFNSDIFNNSVSGTCSISSKLANRLATGYLLNYTDNTFNQSGHQILSIQDGYKLSGVIPCNHNILSSTGILIDDRLGFSSIVSTGSPILLSGVKTQNIVGSDDIGYTEFYRTNASGFPIDNFLSSGIYGKGTASWPYKIFIDTSGSSTNTRMVELLYLGHNSNMLNFYGVLSTSGSIGDFSITQIKLADQLHIEHLSKFGLISGVAPAINTGTLGYDTNINWSLPVDRYDIIQLRITPNNMPSGNNACYLYSYMEDPANPLPLKLDHPSLVNTGTPYFPAYRDINKSLFYILPTINTTVKYCNSNKSYNKNNNVFYNGNIIRLNNLDSIKSFLNKNDHIKLQKINDANIIGGLHINKINNSNETTYVTGISIDGKMVIPPNQYLYANKALLEDTDRHVDVFSTGINTRTPISGYVEFIGYNSGLFNLIDYNNLIVQSYGGSTARWPQDTDGHLVPPIFTGIYSVVDNGTSTCTSGRLCVSISGYKNTPISDHILFDKYYYFDFIDGMPLLSNLYKIKDKLSYNKISIDIPYNTGLINNSGIVYLIDSHFNLKPHLDPNLNNAFVRNVATLSNVNNIDLLEHTIHAFDDSTKKWNHIFHLPQTLPAFSSYPISVSIGSALQSGNIVHYSEIPKIGIRDVSVLKNRDFAIFDTVTNNMSAYSDTDALTVRVRISGGTPPLNTNISINTPKVFISGVAEYNFLYFDSLYGYKSSGWDIGINIYPFKNTGVFPIAIGVFDETGSDYKYLNLRITERPIVLPTYPTGYASVTSPYWKLYFDIKGIDLEINNPNNQGLFVYGSPNDFNYNFVRRSSSELELIGYPAGGGFSTGIWNPIVTINDFYSGNVIASGSGSLYILPSLNDRPLYTPYINNLNTNMYINLAKNENISFQVPVYETDQQHSSITTSVNGGVYFGTTRIFAGFDPNLNRFNIEYVPTSTGNTSYLSETAYAADRPVNFSVSQPIYINGNPSWTTYTSENYLTNFTFFRPLLIDTTFTNTVPEFEINKPWVYEFAIVEGVCKHRPDLPPRVTLFNTPSIGSVIHQYLSYSLSYRYDSTNKMWIVTAQGKPDIYDKYAPSTGIYTISIFADDTYGSYSRSSFNIKYIPTNSIQYVFPNLYNTPNNEFFIQADIKEPNSGVYPNITFDGENTIDMNYANMYKKYNKDLNIWEVAGTGNKFVQKWDARILIDKTSASPSITLQCKGIATDKITAVAKVNLLELQNTNRDIVIDQAKPIKISGIKNYTNPESGIIIKQGNQPWTLEFDTIFGLESPLHPPTIILQNTPTFCTGYDPRLDPKYSDVIDPNLQNPCSSSSSPSFDDELKAWHFIFTGVPSCSLLGPLPFSITAIDTNLVLENPYIEPPDIVDTLFTYVPIDIPHPNPVVQDKEDPQEQLLLKPLCNTFYFRKLKFGPKEREQCPQPTGLTGIIISGSLPSGLIYTINYPSYLLDNPFNAPLYNNLQSGEVIIQGYPLSFAPNGNRYDETFGITVVDARNNSGSKVLTFDQTVSINDPNISIAVYFDSDKPVFTPSTGLQILSPQGMYRWRPEPIVDELECHSILPNNTCPTKIIPYSGQQEPDSLLFLLMNDTNHFGIQPEDLVIGNEVYIRINQDANNVNNGRYFLKKTTTAVPGFPVPPNLWYVNTKEAFAPRTGLVDIVVGNHKFENINDLNNLFNGDIQYNFGCLLGNGSIGNDVLNNKLGIKGYLSPGFSGYVPTNGAWKSNDVRLTGLNFINIDSSNVRTNIAYTNCWETGYLRISGVVLPRPYVEITDPPPAKNNNFSSNGTTFALNTRLSFGNTELERGLEDNWRNGNANYALVNLYTNQTGLFGSVPVSLTPPITPISLAAADLASSAGSTGTVFRLDIKSPANTTFPTFNVQARPAAIPSTYFWIHKATPTIWTPPSQSSLPPIIPCLPDTISIVSGSIIEFNSLSDFGIDGVAYGGYIPHDICTPACPPGYTNELYYTSGGSQWQAKDYLPIISGIILESINTKNNFTTTGSYDSSAQTVLISNINNVLSEGNLIDITITKTEWNNEITVVDSFIAELSSTNIVENNVVFYNKIYTNIGQSALMIDIKFLNQIKDIDTINNLITVYHNNLNLSINDNIAMSSVSGSTSLNAIDMPGVPYISTIDNTGLVINTNLYNNFNIGDYVSLHKIIEDNIKIMPNNISSDQEGIYDFKISGRANILYGNYFYRIMTKENTDMPIFSDISTNIVSKKYERDIPMMVSKPLKILSTSVAWPSASNSWTVTLEIDGGRLPALSETIDVRIDPDDTENYVRCGFRRFPINKDKDIFNTVNNTTIITLSSIPNIINWNNQSAFRIRISDSTGEDSVLILKDTI